MTTEFHQHPDGHIFVRTESGTYSDTLENFELDYGQKVPPLPPNAIERIYVPGVRHPISDGTNVLEGGPMPWEYGDRAIEGVSDLLKIQEKRIAAEVKNLPEVINPQATALEERFSELENRIARLEKKLK